MLSRISKYALKNIFRNTFLSLSSLVVLTLLMFFINILFVLHDVSLNLINSVNSKLTISLYLDDQYDRNTIEVIDLLEDIKQIEGGVDIEYKTKEDILEEMRLREPELAKILERTNPLPDTIELSNIGLKQYSELNSVIENKLFILASEGGDEDHFSQYTAQYKKIEQVIRILHLLQGGLYVIFGVFLISISIITYSIIGNFIYYYRDEIYITRLVGGSKVFIYGPFVLQGAFYSFLSFWISLGIFVFLIKNLNLVFDDFYLLHISYQWFLLEMLVFTFMGGLSGFFSSRKYLK